MPIVELGSMLRVILGSISEKLYIIDNTLKITNILFIIFIIMYGFSIYLKYIEIKRNKK